MITTKQKLLIIFTFIVVIPLVGGITTLKKIKKETLTKQEVSPSISQQFVQAICNVSPEQVKRALQILQTKESNAIIPFLQTCKQFNQQRNISMVSYFMFGWDEKVQNAFEIDTLFEDILNSSVQ